MAFLLDDLLLSPLTLVVWLGQKLEETASAQAADGSSVRGELLDLEMLLELDEISRDEYRLREDEVLRRLS